MPRTPVMVNTDPFANVRLRNIENNGRATDKFMVEMEDESGEFREIPGTGTVHSGDYKLVNNQEVYSTAQEILTDSGLKFKPVPTFNGGHSRPTVWNGRRFSAKWYVEDAAVEAPDGSNVMLGIEATNSYDGSSKVGFSFFAMRLVCSNQFYSRNMLGKPFVFPHINRGGDLDEDIKIGLAQLKVQAGSFAKVLPKLKALQETRCESFNDFLQLRSGVLGLGFDMRDKHFLNELSGRGITQELGMKDVTYTDPSSYWSIANAATAVTTHLVGGYRGPNQSTRVVDYLLDQADQAA